MRWRAVSKRIKKETEALAGVFRCHSQRLEHNVLDVTAVNTNRSTGDFDTVDNSVVRLRTDLAKQIRLAVLDRALEQRQVLIDRRSERMVHRIIAAVIVVV